MATSEAKIKRAMYGPSLFEVTLGAVLSLTLGAVLAMAYLTAKPAETVRALPKELEKGKVYFIEGSNNGTKGRQYLRKRQLFLEGGSADVISLSEDELNSWINASVANAKGDTAGAFLAAKTINFRIRDGVFQIGLPSTLDLFGFASIPVVIQTRGHFEKRADQFVFEPDETYLGSLAAHRVPGVENLVLGRLMAAQEIPAELSAAWKRLDRVAVEGDQLVLALP